MSDKSDRLLLRGAFIIPVDPSMPEVIKGDLIVEGSRIVAVGQQTGEDFDGRVFELENRIVIPGLVDTHRHCWQTLLRYSGVDWDLPRYGRAMWHTVGPRMAADDAYLSIRLALADAVNSGVTQVMDWNHNVNSPEHADAAVDAHRDSYARTIFGYGQSSMAWADLMDPDLLTSNQPPSQDLRRLRSQFYAGDDQLQTIAVAARGPELSPDSVVQQEIELARELDLRSSVHVRRGYLAPVRKLQALGAQLDRLTLVHANGLHDDELDLISENGGAVSVSAGIEMRMGHGPPVISRLWDRRITTSLSIDTCASASGDLFTAMRMALSLARQEAHLTEQTSQEKMPTARDGLRWATLEGAKANGLGHLTGSLTPGKAADIIVINATAPHMIPMNNPVGSVVIGASPGDVEMVIIDGRVVKEGGRLLLDDLGTLNAKAVERRDALFGKVGASLGSWDPLTSGSLPDRTTPN